jgi:mRNA interferase RelE/StbE
VPVYTAYWDERAVKELKNISPEIAERIKNKVKNHLVNAPKDLGTPMTGNYRGFYRYKIGDYRVIYKIYEARIEILIVQVGHRKNVYDK